MPSTVKKTIVIGGLMVFGFLAGGKLGSLLGTALGAYVCQMLDVGPVVEHPSRQIHQGSSHCNGMISSRKVRKSRDATYKSSECVICLERFRPSILFVPCSHMCLCDNCYENSRHKLCNLCPVCRRSIDEFKKI